MKTFFLICGALLWLGWHVSMVYAVVTCLQDFFSRRPVLERWLTFTMFLFFATILLFMAAFDYFTLWPHVYHRLVAYAS